MNADANMLSPARAEVLRRFAAHIEGPQEALFLVVCENELSEQARNALAKTALALRWDDGPTYASVNAPAPLQKAEVYELIEGLDPVCVVLCGQAVCDIAQSAYAQEIPRNKRLRLFGRNTCALQDFETMLGSDKGKQEAWELLKSLPACPAS